MPPTSPLDLVELDRATCLALLGSVPVGRLVHSQQALPAVTPMNFALLGDGIYLRTAADSPVRRLADQGSVVAFEADDYDADGRFGWSVVVLGRAGLVTEPLTLARVAELPLVAWAGGLREHVVRISLELVNGRRAGAAVRLPPSTHDTESGPTRDR